MFDLQSEDRRAPFAVQQSPAFARALKHAGVPYVQLARDTLAVRRRVGPLTAHMITRPTPTEPDELADLVSDRALQGPLILAPEHPAPLQQIGALPLVGPSTLAVVDLSPDHDVLMGRLYPKWRNRLRHAERQNLRITRQNMPQEATHWLLDADEVQQRQRGYRGWPRALTLAFAAANPGRAKLFTAFWGREPVAAMLVLRHGTTATYHIGHTRPSGRITSAHTLLMWQAMLWAQSKGLTRFELGMLNTEDTPGLARFKLGTGAQPYRLGGIWLMWRPLKPLARPLSAMDRALMLPHS